MKKLILNLMTPLVLLFAHSIAQAAESWSSEEEAKEIAVEGYIYFYSLISMDITRQITTNLKAGVKPGFGPAGEFHHMREYPTAQFRDVVRPNFDTLYSSAWIDLSKEPVIISAPDTNGRYYLLPILDYWTDIFAVPGSRTSGTKAKNFAVVPKGWKGTLPKGVDKIEAPTVDCWVIGRTQTNGPSDYDAVHKVQDGYKITPLSQWGRKPKPSVWKFDSSIDMKTPPLVQVNTMSGAEYFKRATKMMKRNQPHVIDWPIIERLKRIGIEVGKEFNINTASPTVRAAIEQAPAEGLKRMNEKLPTLAKLVNGWQMNVDTMGTYGTFYLKRAIVAMVGLGANLPEDAVYPMNIVDSDGEPAEGDEDYVIHFDKGQLPPTDAFWSITMYDAEGFQVANSLNRFAIGDRDKLTFNKDGSLDLYIQHESPGADKESNWLPGPANGKLGITMRIYAPKAAVLEGRWNPPALTRN